MFLTLGTAYIVAGAIDVYLGLIYLASIRNVNLLSWGYIYLDNNVTVLMISLSNLVFTAPKKISMIRYSENERTYIQIK